MSLPINFARLSLLRCSVIGLVFALAPLTTSALSQQPNLSQRPLPLPENGTNNVEQQFRMMQQLQRLVQQPPSNTPFNLQDFAPDNIDQNLFNSEQAKEFMEGLNPQQRDALRDLAQSFQSEMQNKGTQPKSPAELQDLLQDFLRDRKLPEFQPGNQGPNIPSLPQSDPNANDPAAPPTQTQPQTPQQQTPEQQTPDVPKSLPDNRPTPGQSAISPLLEQLASEPDNLPPVAPPPHLEKQASEQAEAARKRASDAARERAIEQQNQIARSRTERGLPDNSQSMDSSDSKITPEPENKSVDTETAQRLRSDVGRRGLGETLRDLFQQTQKEAKQEAINEAREKARKTLEQANQEIARQTANSPQNAGPKDQRSRRSASSDNNSSLLSGIVDQELVESLASDQKQLEQMVRELQQRASQMAAEERANGSLPRKSDRQQSAKGSPDNAANDTENSSPESTGDSDASSPQNGKQSSTSRSNEAESSGQPFDMDPLGIGNPVRQSEQRSGTPSLAKRLSNWYQSLTGGEVDSTAEDDDPFRNPEELSSEQSSTTSSSTSSPWQELQIPNLSFLVLMLLLAVAGLAAWWLLRKTTTDEGEKQRRAIYARLMPTQIRSREDLIQAFHCVALASPAAPPTWWTHPKTAETIAMTSPSSKSAVYTLANLYELARYSPDGERITQAQLVRANEALIQLKGLANDVI